MPPGPGDLVGAYIAKMSPCWARVGAPQIARLKEMQSWSENMKATGWIQPGFKAALQNAIAVRVPEATNEAEVKANSLAMDQVHDAKVAWDKVQSVIAEMKCWTEAGTPEAARLEFMKAWFDVNAHPLQAVHARFMQEYQQRVQEAYNAAPSPSASSGAPPPPARGRSGMELDQDHAVAADGDDGALAYSAADFDEAAGATLDAEEGPADFAADGGEAVGLAEAAAFDLAAERHALL